MSDILKNNAISDDELGRVSGGVVDMTPEQKADAIAYIKQLNLQMFPLEQAIAFVSTPGFYEKNENTFKTSYGIDTFDELIEFLYNEWANIQ